MLILLLCALPARAETNAADILVGGRDADLLYGEAGFDIASYEDSVLGVNVALDKSIVATEIAEGDRFSGIEGLRGSSQADILVGDRNINDLRGLNGDDLLKGQGGHDFLSGGLGADTLSGGSGYDRFFFGALEEAGDHITDFASKTDRLQFAGAAFGGLATGVLNRLHFAANANGAAVDGAQWFLYNTTTGALAFDADGSGSGAAVEIVTLDGRPVLTASDIYIA